MSKSPAALALASARAEVTRLLAVVKSEREFAKLSRVTVKSERAALKQVRAETRAQRKAERVAKLEAKLAALKSPVVGVKAMRANRKPSKVTVLQGASA